MLGRLHLVRHGEVADPRHVCYGDLPGFGLSPAGRLQAEGAAAHLAAAGADLLLTSPLARAVETAGIIGRRLGLVPVPDGRLTEWRLGVRWNGVVWEDLPAAFPGELEAYLEHPADLPFSPESLGGGGRAHRGPRRRIGGPPPRGGGGAGVPPGSGAGRPAPTDPVATWPPCTAASRATPPCSPSPGGPVAGGGMLEPAVFGTPFPPV